MNIYWLFISIIAFCIYILFGLHISEGLESSSQIILSWVIYTILWITFLNIFSIGYFWSVVRSKTGPGGLRGPGGETGEDGIKGECGITASQAYCMSSLNDYINNLYKAETAIDILDQETQTFPCVYLNKKIQKLAGSRQYQVIVANLSNENKSIDNIINYLKSIWKQWFDLIYNGTTQPGVWFTDEFGDENYEWSGNNPFDEIKKYDIYYWGITRDFRPLKAEICRADGLHSNSKFPKPHYLQEPRLKIMQTNNYQFIANDKNSGAYYDASWWRPNPVSLNGDSYHPVGDIVVQEWNPRKYGNLIVGDFSNRNWFNTKNGPDMKSILVSGDIKEPLGYQSLIRPDDGDSWQGPFNVLCPEGYTDMGNIVVSARWTPNNRWSAPPNTIKCVPTDCVEPLNNGGNGVWEIWNWWHYAINDSRSGYNEATGDNGYNLFRTQDSYRPFYRIKQSCLDRPPLIPQESKEVEKEYADLGIGWYGHPYKLEPKYSIFSFLNIVPEGIIVNVASGHRFYIVHYGGEDINVYNVLTYNKNTNKYDAALQVTNISSINLQKENFKDTNNNTNNNILNTYTIKNRNGKDILYDNKTHNLTLNTGYKLLIDVKENLEDLTCNIEKVYYNLDSKQTLANTFLKSNNNIYWKIHYNDDGSIKLYTNTNKFLGYDKQNDNIKTVPENDPSIESWYIHTN